jgi:hypothetical protein
LFPVVELFALEKVTPLEGLLDQEYMGVEVKGSLAVTESDVEVPVTGLGVAVGPAVTTDVAALTWLEFALTPALFAADTT